MVRFTLAVALVFLLFGRASCEEFDGVCLECQIGLPHTSHIKARPLIPLAAWRGWQLYTDKSSSVEREQESIIDDYEDALERLEWFFGRTLKRPIHVIIHSNSWGKAQRERFCQVFPARRAILISREPGRWANETKNVMHPLAHLLSETNSTGAKVNSVDLLSEGLAEYLGNGLFDPHLCCTDYLQATDERKNPLDLIQRDFRCRLMGSSLAGSFVKFLVEEQPDGHDKVLELLESSQTVPGSPAISWDAFVSLTEEIFGKSWQTLGDEWALALEPYWSQSISLSFEDQASIQGLLHRLGYPKARVFRYFCSRDFLQLVAVL